MYTMHSQLNQLNATVILRDENDYRTWYNQLQARCTAYNIWDQVNPDATNNPTMEPTQPDLPDISQYTPTSTLGAETVPTRLSDLSSSGQRAYKDDLEIYKLKMERYKLQLSTYKTEATNRQQTVTFIQSTVAPHLQRTCCLPDKTIKEWIKNLQSAVGVTPDFEQKQARHRYQNALKPPRSANTWDLWLAEYDQAATEAERLSIAQIKAVFAVASILDRSKYPLSNSFILDSGSTCHITNKPDRIYSYRPPSYGDFIGAGNSQIWIKGYGSIVLHLEKGEKLVLYDVAICPDILCNIVSFRVLRKQGIWWDTQSNPTAIKRSDGSTICELTELYGQWVLECQPTGSMDKVALHAHSHTSRTHRRPQQAPALLWHKRLGHPGPAAIEHLVQQAEGVQIKGVTTVQCNACGRAKIRRQISRAPRKHDQKPGERITIDFHSYEKQSYNKELSQLLITDKYSRLQWDFYLIDNRTARSIIKILTNFLTFLKNQYNITPKVVETDNEIATVKPEVMRWLQARGIIVEPSAPDTQAQNGGAERSGGVNKEKARAMRLDANLPWELWPEVTRAAVYLYNRTPNYVNQWKTPYEVFFTHVSQANGIATPKKPRLAHLKAYGCKAFAMTDDTHRGKSRLQRLDPKAWIGYLVGYQASTIYRIWIPSDLLSVR
ncbi:rve multi-domain protein [Pyrenophora tritici-repentis]|nr:rve multi-domain protein [Pyrenophora tritici-repentis]